MRIREKNLCLMIAYFIILMQILSPLRASAIFNTSYLSNVLRLIINLIFIIMVFLQSKKKIFSLNSFDLIYLIIPVLALFYGAVYNGISRDWASDFFNAFSFYIIILYFKAHRDFFDKDLLFKMSRILLWGTVVSFFIYQLFILSGIRILSVGRLSQFILFPLSVYLIYGDKRWIFIYILILIGQKRGVILSAFLLSLFYYAIVKRLSFKGLFAIIMATSVIVTLLFITSSPILIHELPTNMQSVLFRFMRVNPFYEDVDYYSDARVREITGAIAVFKEHPLRVFFGNGNGYTYELYSGSVLVTSDRHNVHFTPVTLLTRYGIFYTLAFYLNIIWAIKRGIKYANKGGKQRPLYLVLTLYMFSFFVDSFTAFLPYVDYLAMICFGVLGSNLQSYGKLSVNGSSI